MKSYLQRKPWFSAIKVILLGLMMMFSINAYSVEYYYVDDYNYYYYDCPRPRPRCYDCNPCDYVVCDHFSYTTHYRRAPQRGVGEVQEYVWIDP